MVKPVVTDLVILAIDASEIAIRKKNIAYSVLTADRGFLAHMDTDGGNAERGIAFAPGTFPVKPVGMTVPRTVCTIFKRFQRAGEGIKIQGSGGIFRYF